MEAPAAQGGPGKKKAQKDYGPGDGRTPGRTRGREDQGGGARRKRERNQGQIGPRIPSFCLAAASVFVGTVSTCIGWEQQDDALGGCDAEIPQFMFAFGDKHEKSNQPALQSSNGLDQANATQWTARPTKSPMFELLHQRPPTVFLDFVPSYQEA